MTAAAAKELFLMRRQNFAPNAVARVVSMEEAVGIVATPAVAQAGNNHNLRVFTSTFDARSHSSFSAVTASSRTSEHCGKVVITLPSEN